MKGLTQIQINEMKETLMFGGYYKYDLTDRISVIAVNTIYFD